MDARPAPAFLGPSDIPDPLLHPVPEHVGGVMIRLELDESEPVVWRRLQVPGDLTLARLHHVIQAAMGWTDSHLHRFRMARDFSSPHFVTTFDIDEGDEGVCEDDVRLDQVVAGPGDELWYEYDFGDGWEHVLRVEQVLVEPPAETRCTAGELACPPEDCGGIGGYLDLAAWVRSGDDALLPEVFDDHEDARGWLPERWHPDRLDLGEVNTAITMALAEPVQVSGELAELLRDLDRHGDRRLRHVLSRPISHARIEVSDEEAARLTEPYRILLDVVGDGVALTGAGYLPPSVVEQFSERSGVMTWWIGKANREDLTPPVRQVREAARALGLVSVRKGRLAPTAAARRCQDEPLALWRHVVDRLPVGTSRFDRAAGWLALAVVGSGATRRQAEDEIVDLLEGLGWQVQGVPAGRPPYRSPTFFVLEHLAGAVRDRRAGREPDAAVTATARAAIRT